MHMGTVLLDVHVEVLMSFKISEVKAEIEKHNGTPVAEQRLIFSGHVLRDESTLESYGVTEGVTLNMVRSAPPRAVQTPAEPNVPAGGGPRGGSGSSLANMREQLLQNPEIYQQILDVLSEQYPEFATPEGRAALEQIINDPEALGNLLEQSGIGEGYEEHVASNHDFTSEELASSFTAAYSALNLTPSSATIDEDTFMQSFVTAIQALAHRHNADDERSIEPTARGVAAAPTAPQAPAHQFVSREYLAACMEAVMQNLR
eukprot:CFRG1325T1